MSESLGKKLFVHIGQAKTGSTSIQAMLHRLAPGLEQEGLHVVATHNVRGNHGRLVMSGAGENPLRFGSVRQHWRDLFEEVARCGASRFVVSAEQFLNPSARLRSVEFFVELSRAANLKVEVIACIRPQWQWLESSWAQRVWTGIVSPPFADCLEKNVEDPRLDYAGLLLPWKQAFGAVTVIPVEPSRLPDGLVVRFLGVLGVDDERIVSAAGRLPDLNRRHGAKAVEVRRLVGQALHRHGMPGWQRVGAMRRMAGLSRLMDGDRPFAGLSLQQIDGIVRRFEAGNVRLAREYGVDIDGRLFQDHPVDGYVRPTRPTWEDLSAEERVSVTEFVGCRLGLELPGGDRLPAGAVKGARGASVDVIGAALADADRKGAGAWFNAAASTGLELLRGLAQIRFSRRGLLIFRWLRWRLWQVAQTVRRQFAS